MKELEAKILKTFKSYEGEAVKGLNLLVATCEDEWPDDEGIYHAQVMEPQDNGRVWECVCTRNGKVKETYEL